jgi:hypothetical protein
MTESSQTEAEAIEIRIESIAQLRHAAFVTPAKARVQRRRRR